MKAALRCTKLGSRSADSTRKTRGATWLRFFVKRPNVKQLESRPPFEYVVRSWPWRKFFITSNERRDRERLGYLLLPRLRIFPAGHHLQYTRHDQSTMAHRRSQQTTILRRHISIGFCPSLQSTMT